MDPIQMFILQMLQGGAPVQPEYSATRGWQPVDIGTMSSNLNYQQDLLKLLADPVFGGLTGNYDPSSFDPVETVEMPEAPETPLLDLYGESQDPVMQTIIAGLSQGATPDQVIRQLQADGAISAAKLSELDGKTIDNSEAEAWLGQAQQLQGEIAARRRFEATPPTVTSEDSEAMEKFRALGLPSPNDRYSERDVLPKYDQRQQKATEAVGSYDQAMNEFLAAKAQAPKEPQTSTPSTNALANFDPVKALALNAANAASAVGGGVMNAKALGRVAPTPAAPNIEGLERRANQSRQQAVDANLQARIDGITARRRLRTAERQGHTPLMDVLMGRAGF